MALILALILELLYSGTTKSNGAKSGITLCKTAAMNAY